MEIETLLKSDIASLAKKVIELEEKVVYILNLFKIPTNTDFKKNVVEVCSSKRISKTNEKELSGTKSVNLIRKIEQVAGDLSKVEKWVGGGKGDFQCQVCGMRFLTKLKLDYHKMKLKHRHQRQIKEIVNTPGRQVKKKNKAEDEEFNDGHLDDTDADPASPLEADAAHWQPSNMEDIDEVQPETEQANKAVELPMKKKVVSTRMATRKLKPEVDKKEEEEAGDFHCQVFGMGFPTKVKLDNHKSKEMHRIRKNNNEKLTCEHCGFESLSGAKFRMHLRKHSKDKPYLCNLCGKSFARAYYLTSHMKVHEIVERNWQCKYCKSMYKTQNDLKIHYMIHEGKREKVCPYCGKSIMNLLRHIKEVHEKIRAHKCHLCDHKFKKKAHLQRHLGSHANPNRRVKGYHIERPEVIARIKGERKLERVTRIVEQGDGNSGTIDVTMETCGDVDKIHDDKDEIECDSDINSTSTGITVPVPTDVQNDN